MTAYEQMLAGLVERIEALENRSDDDRDAMIRGYKADVLQLRQAISAMRNSVDPLVKALKMFSAAFDESEVDWGPAAARADLAACEAIKPFEVKP